MSNEERDLELALIRAEIEEKKALAAKYRVDAERAQLDADIQAHEEKRRFNLLKSETRTYKERELAERDRTLYLTAGVDDAMAESVSIAFAQWDIKNDLSPEPNREATLIIHSHGGSVVDGLEIYDTIVRYRNDGWKINTRITGIAASMAGVIAQAGEVREITPFATFHMHELSSAAWGSYSEIRDRQKFHEMLMGKLATILSERSALSQEEVLRLFETNRDTYLSADQALEMGLVDVITR